MNSLKSLEVRHFTGVEFKARCVCHQKLATDVEVSVETLRFEDEDEDDCEDEIWLNVFFRSYFQKIDTLKASFYFFIPEKLIRLFLLKEIKPSPDRQIVKLLSFDNLYPPLRHYRPLDWRERQEQNLLRIK